MNSKLSRSQILMIGSSFVLDATLVSKPSLVIKDLEGDFWLAFLLALLYGAAAVACITALASRFPRKDVLEGLISASPAFGRLIAAGYVLFFFGILVRDVRSASDFVKATLLTATPTSVIAACLSFCLIAIARHGRLSVARMSQLWQPMLIFILLFSPLMLGISLTFENLLPVFQHDPMQIAGGGSHLYAYAGEATGIALIASYRPWMRRYNLYSIALGWALLLILTFSVVMSMGVEIPARTFYPNYELIRKLRLTDFLDRLDLPMIGVWLPAMAVKASFSLYIAANGVSLIAPKLKLSAAAIVLGAAAFAAAMLGFGNALQIVAFDRLWTPAAFFFQLLLPALLLLFFRRRKKPPAVPAADA